MDNLAQAQTNPSHKLKEMLNLEPDVVVFPFWERNRLSILGFQPWNHDYEDHLRLVKGALRFLLWRESDGKGGVLYFLTISDENNKSPKDQDVTFKSFSDLTDFLDKEHGINK